MVFQDVFSEYIINRFSQIHGLWDICVKNIIDILLLQYTKNV